MTVEYTGLFIIDGSTSDPVVLARILEAFASTPELAPQYWGTLERSRNPYDAEAIQKLAANEKLQNQNFYQSSIFVSRGKKLAYKAMLTLTDASVAKVKLWFKTPTSVAALRAIYESVTELASKLPLVYGGMHPVARKGEEVAGMTFREAILCLEGVYAEPGDIRAEGAPRPAARTWYGPLLVERIGVSVLEQLGAKARGESMLLELVAEPWNATIPQLFARQSVVLPKLKATGMFAESELDEKGHTVRTAAGAAWRRPAWVLGLRDKEAKAADAAWVPAARPDPEAKRLASKVDLFPSIWLERLPKDVPRTRGGDVSGLDLSGANVYGVVGDDATAVGVNLSGATLAYFKFIDSDFSRANFTGAKISGGYFFDCKLHGANFQGASVRQAMLATAQCEDAVFDDADLSGADFSGGWLDRASLRKAKLVGANLHLTTLRGAVLTEADLTKADLTEADLTDADLRGATLTGVKWTRANITGARFDPKVEARVRRSIEKAK